MRSAPFTYSSLSNWAFQVRHRASDSFVSVPYPTWHGAVRECTEGRLTKRLQTDERFIAWNKVRPPEADKICRRNKSFFTGWCCLLAQDLALSFPACVNIACDDPGPTPTSSTRATTEPPILVDPEAWGVMKDKKPRKPKGSTTENCQTAPMFCSPHQQGDDVNHDIWRGYAGYWRRGYNGSSGTSMPFMGFMAFDPLHAQSFYRKSTVADNVSSKLSFTTVRNIDQ